MNMTATRENKRKTDKNQAPQTDRTSAKQYTRHAKSYYVQVGRKLDIAQIFLLDSTTHLSMHLSGSGRRAKCGAGRR